jgi:septal ring factor EnvC (AmiA/AmiB activator)
MKLLDIADEFQKLYELASESDDVETLQELYKEIEVQLEEKADNTRLILSKLDSDIEFLNKEIKRLQKRKKMIEHNKESLKTLLSIALKMAGVEKLKTKKATFYFAPTPPRLVINDENLIPEDFKETKIEINKQKLKEALKKGFEIKGVTLEQNETLRIR